MYSRVNGGVRTHVYRNHNPAPKPLGHVYHITALVKRILPAVSPTHGFLSVSRLSHEPSQHVPGFYCAVPHFSRSLRDMCQDGSGASGNRTPRAAMLAYGFLMHRNQPAGQQSTNVNLLYAPYFF